MCYVTVVTSVEIFYTRFSYKQRWISSLGELMQLYESNECCLSFRIVFICFHLLPVLINASLSVCVSVYNFHCFLPQQSDGLSAMRLLIQIDCQTIRTHTHTLSMFVCVCALITSTDLSMYNGTSIHECVCVCDGETLDRFFVRFLFCVYVWWLLLFSEERRCFRFAFVCLFAVKSHLHCN